MIRFSWSEHQPRLLCESSPLCLRPLGRNISALAGLLVFKWPSGAKFSALPVPSGPLIYPLSWCTRCQLQCLKAQKNESDISWFVIFPAPSLGYIYGFKINYLRDMVELWKWLRFSHFGLIEIVIPINKKIHWWGLVLNFIILQEHFCTSIKNLINSAANNIKSIFIDL